MTFIDYVKLVLYLKRKWLEKKRNLLAHVREKAKDVRYGWIGSQSHQTSVCLSSAWLSSEWWRFSASLLLCPGRVASCSSRLTSYQLSKLWGEREPLDQSSHRSPEAGSHRPGVAHPWAGHCWGSEEVRPGAGSELGSQEQPPFPLAVWSRQSAVSLCAEISLSWGT